MNFIDLNENIITGDLAFLKSLEIKENETGLNILCSDSKGQTISIVFSNYYTFMVRKEVIANYELDNNEMKVFSKNNKSWFIDLSSKTLNFTYETPIHYQIFSEFEVIDILANSDPKIKII